MKWDGHTHTRHCYHGSGEAQESYLDRAVELGFERYTISEHPPLPEGWVNDRKLWEELAMPEEELPVYMAYAQEMKRRYEGRIDVAVGLELDYLPDRPEYTERIVERWERELEDVVYSVHFLPGADGMYCIDFTPDDFRTNLLSYYGTMDKLAEQYYDQVEAAIERAARLPMRTRIGHINLIEKFRLALPELDESLVRRRMEGLLPLLAKSGVGVDVNTAGLRVPTCGKPYVPDWFIAECRRLGIACVYGSDAHKPEHVGAGWEWFAEQTGTEA